MWDNTYGGSNDEEVWTIQQTTDGGYILAGETASYSNGGSDAWLLKINSQGMEQWNRSWGGSLNDEGFCAQQTSDGGYILVGYYIHPESDNHDIWLIKTNSYGNRQWDKFFDGGSKDWGFYVQQTNDNGYIVTGFTGDHAWLIKTDSNGNELWNKTFGNNRNGWCVQQTTDGGYIISGTDNTNILYLIKTDSDGNELWNKTFGGAVKWVGQSVRQTTDDGYVIVSTKDQYLWLIKTDSSGILECDKLFSGKELAGGYSVQQTADGRYIATGWTREMNGDADVYLIKAKIIYDMPPEIPQKPSGPTSGRPDIEYTYTTNTTDPDGDDVYYYVDWGDGTNTGWDGPYSSGAEVIQSHSWSKIGKYTIKAKAKDIYDTESDWATLEVTMPRNKIVVNTFFLNLLKRFTNVFPILTYLLS